MSASIAGASPESVASLNSVIGLRGPRAAGVAADQSLALQRNAPAQAGCETICEDPGVSGSVERRPGLDQALKLLGQGDVLVTWRLDRLGRSLPHLITLVASLNDRGCGFRPGAQSA